MANQRYGHGINSQHKRQPAMRVVIRTMMIRDREGYEVRDFGERPPKNPGETLLEHATHPSGIHIVGKVGVNEKDVWISSELNLRLWEKARKLETPDSVADFMSRWGQVSRWLTDDGSRPYNEAYFFIEEHLTALKRLANFVDANDKSGFCSSLNRHLLLDRANIAIDASQAELPLVIE